MSHALAPDDQGPSKSEPVAWAGIAAAAVTFVTAVCGLLVAIGVDISPDQQKALLAALAAAVTLVGTVAPIVAALRARGKVVPYADVIAHVLPNGGPIVAGPPHPAVTGTVVTLPPPTGDQTGAAG